MPKQSYPFYDHKHNMKKTKQMIKKVSRSSPF